MLKLLFSIVISFFLINAESSDFGTTGLIDTPTARMLNDGDLKASMSFQKIANIYNSTYQATPWLETTFRYTIFNPDNPYRNSSHVDGLNDRSYAAKIKLFNESKYLPQVALGIQDILGTGAWSGEYIVASKQINQFDFSVGLGWGRLAERDSFSNPIGWVHDHFKTRGSDGGIRGGETRASSFFTGKDVGLFGGLSYRLPKYNLTLLAEYNSDAYKREIAYGTIKESSPISYGFKWNGFNNLTLGISRQQGNQWGLMISSRFNTKELMPRKNTRPFYSSTEDKSLSNMPDNLNSNLWYDLLFHDLNRSGILLRKAQVINESRQVDIEISNYRYELAADAINRALTFSEIHIPKYFTNINIILNEDNFRVMTFSYQRIGNGNFLSDAVSDSRVNILKSRDIINPTQKTKLIIPSGNLGVDLAARVQLFDPYGPLKHQFYLKLTSKLGVGKGWNVIGTYALNIDHNFDNDRGPNSNMPHVRSEIDEYLTKGASGIDALYFEKRETLNPQLYYRAYIGILEQMYSGAGGELLYLPFKARWALGATMNYVKKRAYNRGFDLLDYETVTAFASLYYASPLYNYDVAIHAGRYLAEDKGATIELRRTFDNGFSIGAFATLTNVSAVEFGEGSFDKGLYFQLPFNSFLGANTRGKYATQIRSIQRDGGQRLEDFSGRLWHDLRNVRYDSLERHKSRMIPK